MFKLQAALGKDFNSTFKTAMKTNKQLQSSIQKVNSVQGKIDSYTKCAKAIDSQSQKIQRLKQEHENVASKLERHKQQAKQLEEAIEKTGDASGELTAQLNKEKNEIERCNEKIKHNEAQTKQATAAIDREKSKLEELGQELKKAGVNTENLEGENGRLQKSYEKLRQSQESYQKLAGKQKEINEAIGSTKKKLVGTVGVMGTVATAMYAGPIRVYKGFEEEMSTVAGITGATGKELQSLKNAAKAAGQTTWATASQSAQALEYMSLAGWTSKESISSLNNMLKIAKISGLDLGASTDLVTDSMSAMGLSVKDLQHYLDVTVKANNVANTTSSDLMEALLGCAGAAKTNGVSLETLSTGLSVFANNGLKGSQAGTAMNSILVRMTSNEKSLKETAKLGVDVFDKQTGEFRNMGDILKDLQGKMVNMTDAERDASLKAIAGTNYYSQFAYLLDSVSESAKGTAGSWDVLTKKLNNAEGATDAMYKTMNNNLAGAMTEASSAIEAVQLALGEALTPALTKAVKAVTPYIQKAATFISENKEMVATVAGVIAGLGAMRVGMLSLKLAGLTGQSGIVSLLMNLTKLKGGFLASAAEGKGFVGLLSKGFGKLGGLMSGFGANLVAELFKPFGKIGEMLAPVGKMLAPVGNVIKTIFGPMGGIVGKILPVVGVIITIVSVFKLVKEHIMEIRAFILRTFGKDALAVFDKVVSVVKIVGDTIKNVFSDGNIGSVRDKIQEIFGDKGTAVFDGLVKVIKTTVQIISQLSDYVVSIITQAAPTIMQIIQSVATFIGAVIPVIGQFIFGLLPIINEVVNLIATYVLPVVQQVFDLVVTTVLPAIAQAMQAILPVIQQVLAILLPLIQTAITMIWNYVSPVIQAILAAVQFAMPTILAIVTAVVNTLSGVIQGIATVLQGIITFVKGVFTGNWKQAWEGISLVFKGVWQGIKSYCTGIMNGIIAVINTVIRGLNKIQIPDWVPGVGGKGINIQEIPGYAKGTQRTPDTFIAGEDGPEIITNAPGRTVFTAKKTREILETQRAARVQPERVAPKVAARSNTSNRTTNVNLTSNPTIVVNGDKPDDLDEKLSMHDQMLLQKVKDLLDKRDDDDKRMAYA